jgi:hypothetical protein
MSHLLRNGFRRPRARLDGSPEHRRDDRARDRLAGIAAQRLLAQSSRLLRHAQAVAPGDQQAPLGGQFVLRHDAIGRDDPEELDPFAPDGALGLLVGQFAAEVGLADLDLEGVNLVLP